MESAGHAYETAAQGCGDGAHILLAHAARLHLPLRLASLAPDVARPPPAAAILPLRVRLLRSKHASRPAHAAGRCLRLLLPAGLQDKIIWDTPLRVLKPLAGKPQCVAPWQYAGCMQLKMQATSPSESWSGSSESSSSAAAAAAAAAAWRLRRPAWSLPPLAASRGGAALGAACGACKSSVSVSRAEQASVGSVSSLSSIVQEPPQHARTSAWQIWDGLEAIKATGYSTLFCILRYLWGSSVLL